MPPSWVTSGLAIAFLATSLVTLFARTPRTPQERRIAGMYRVCCYALAFAGMATVLSKHAATEQSRGVWLGSGFTLALYGYACGVAALRSSRKLAHRNALIRGEIPKRDAAPTEADQGQSA